MISQQFLKFLVVGGFSAFVNILSRGLYSLFSSYIVAIVLAFFTALTTAFLLNKFYVFEQSIHKNWIMEYWYFFLVNIFGLMQTLLISYLLILYIFPYYQFYFYTELLAHSIGVIFPVFTSFFGHKYFSFRGKDEKN